MRLTHENNGNGLVRVTAEQPDKIYFRDIALVVLYLGMGVAVFLGTTWLLGLFESSLK
jgi:hypothetical protein